MNPFQKFLNEFINAKSKTIYALAKISGVERSFVQKMKNGSRIPTEISSIWLTPFMIFLFMCKIANFSTTKVKPRKSWKICLSITYIVLPKSMQKAPSLPKVYFQETYYPLPMNRRLLRCLLYSPKLNIIA